MNVKVFGFTWETEQSNIEDFLDYLQSLNTVEFKNLGNMPPGVNYHRVVFTTSLNDGLWGGVFLTVKNTRKFIRSTKSTSGKGFTISTGEIATNENFADANFFIFNPKTGAGLYEYYHLSAYLNTFNHELAKKFITYRTIHKVKDKLIYAPFFTENDLVQRINQLSAVHHLEYELSTISIPDQGMMPASGLVSRQRIKVFYDRSFQSSDLLKRGIAEFIREQAGKIKRMFVKGKTINGDDITYKITDDPSVFNEREFRNYSVNLYVDENDVDKSLRISSNLRELVKISKTLNVSDFFYTERE
ncbi:MAG TPA: hypothetical protein VF571_09405 [Pyrinomonadaceae bacterium]|jgi:hypothetical protein